MPRPDYYKFLSSRANLIEPSPIREMVSKIAVRSKTRQVISFAAGEPDPDVIPRELYAELSSELFKKVRLIGNYSPADGVIDLKNEIAGFMKEFEGVSTSPENIVVTLGGSQAIDLIGRLLLDPGDMVLTENPSYVNTLLVWRHYGVQIKGISMDDHGLIPEELDKTLSKLSREGKRVKLLYTIPTGQNPSGLTLAQERRKHVLEIASKYDILVVEDTAYNHLLYEPIEVKPLRSMDKEGRVIYVGSFSKVLGTGLRIGWLEGPLEVVEKAKMAKGPMDMCPPVPMQYLVLEVLRNKVFKHVKERAIETYRLKRDLMINAIEKYLPGIKYTRPVAGMFVLIWLPRNMEAAQFTEILLEKYDVAAIPATPFYTDELGRSVVRLNFSMAKTDLIDEGIRRIGELLKELTT
jgi:Transcriptional regulators containing a DNA-binding HTH domain and an aminotransferase domain (MocR family) and their eukaryotic orthologs